ncbi:hypothetical protein D9M73_191220 [compost metagenome]
MSTGAIIVVQGKVDRLDALHVVGVAADGVGFNHRIGRMRGQFLLQRGQEGRENVDHETIGGGQDLAYILIDDGIEDDRTDTVLFCGAVDLLYHGPRFFHAVDVRACVFIERNGIELRQKTLSQRLGSDTGAVGNKESRSFHLRLGP